MSLEKRIADILFTQGLDRKTDERLVVHGKLTQLENAVFDNANTIKHRAGFAASTIAALNGGTAVANSMALHGFKDEVLIEAISGLHTVYMGTGSKIRSPEAVTGPFRRAALDVREIAGSDTDQYEMDSATQSTVYVTQTPSPTGTDIANGITTWVWVELQRIGSTSRQIRWLTRNNASGAMIATGLIGNATDDFFRPRVVYNAAGSAFEIYYCVTAAGATTVRHRRITVANPTVITSEHTVGTGLHANACFDAGYLFDTGNGASLMLVYKDDHAAAGDRLMFNLLSTTDGYTVSVGPSLRNATAEITSIAVFLGETANVKYGTALWSVTGGAKVLWETRTLTNPFTLAGQGDAATGLTNPGRVTTILDPGASTKFHVIYEHNSSAANLTMRIGSIELLVNGSATSGVQVNNMCRGCGLASRPFVFDSKVWLPVALLSAVQPTAFVVDFTAQWNSGVGPSNEETPTVVAKILPSEFGNLKGVWSTYLRVPSGTSGGSSADLTFSGKVSIPCSRRSKLQFYKTTDVTVSLVAEALLDMRPMGLYTGQRLQSCESNGFLFFAGAQPRLYDGTQWHEAGFNYYPEITAAGTAAGSMTPSTSISVCAVFEWYDAKGVRHQSAPSVPVTVALTGAQGGIDMTVSTLRLLDKNRTNTLGIPRGVRIVPYRTKSNGTVFYRTQASTRSLEENAVNSDTLTLDLRDADTDLASGELVYTTGGILESDAFEPCKISVIHQNAIFMAGLIDPFEIRYTEQVLEVDRIGPSTNTVYTLRVPETQGKITGLASLDDKLVVTCERGIWYFAGETANRLGLQSTFTPAVLASGQFGHVSGAPCALAVTPDGLWFQASDGLRFLNRGMQVQRGPDGVFMGSDVDDLVSGNCIKAFSGSTKRQTRFLFAGGIVLVYDYQFMQWSKFTGFTSAVDAMFYSTGGYFLHLKSTDSLQAEGDSTSADNGTPFNWIIETGWIKFAELQGFQRIYRLKLLGEFVQIQMGATSPVQLEVAYNYQAAYSTPVSMLTENVFSASPAQIEHHLPVQKCEAIRFKFTLASPTVDSGVRRLTGMSLQVGIKKGFFKTPSSQRM